MDINKMLESFSCECGKKHECKIKYVYVERGAAAHMPEIPDLLQDRSITYRITLK